MPTGSHINGVTITNAAEVAWEVGIGEQPYTTTVVVAKQEAARLRGTMGRPGTLVVAGESGGFTATGVYVVDEQPTADPSMVAFTVADKRWLWTRKHVLRRYNVRRRTGNRRLLTEGFPVEIPGDVADVAYESATLVDGTRLWTAHEAVVDVVTAVDGEKPDTSGLPIRQVPLEGVELDDPGDSAIGRVLDYVPGAAVYVSIDGRTRFLDETERQGAESLLRRFGAPVAGPGLAAPVNYAGIRPEWVDVLFTIEQELKFTSVEEGDAYSRRQDKSKYLENVLPIPDLQLSVGGRTVTRGTYITFDEAFTAWGVPSAAAGGGVAIPGATPPALSHSLVRELWAGGRLEALFTSLGQITAEADWAARVRAVRQHYRQTYRISPYWMARIRSLSAERVAVIDPENGVRAPAFVTADYAYAPSVRGRWIDRNRQGIVINVRAFSENLATAKQAPADVSIVDEQLGIVHLSYSTDALGLWEQVYPCRFAEPIPAMDFGKGAAGPVTTDGAVYEGAAPAILSASHRVAIVITAVPSAPNSNDQLFRVRVTPKEAEKIGPPVGACSGPGWTVRVGAGVATARFAWADAQDALIDKMFGAGRGPSESGAPTYAAGDAMAAAGLLVDQRETTAVARAVAASLYSQMPDRVVGQVAGPLDAGISPVGNATSVVHSLAADGALNSLIRFDRRTGRLDMTAFLDNATRRLLFRQVQP